MNDMKTQTTSKEELRKKALSLKLKMGQIKQLSWNIGQIERNYSIDGNEAEIATLVDAYESAWGDFIHIAQKDMGLVD